MLTYITKPVEVKEGVTIVISQKHLKELRIYKTPYNFHVTKVLLNAEVGSGDPLVHAYENPSCLIVTKGSGVAKTEKDSTTLDLKLGASCFISADTRFTLEATADSKDDFEVFIATWA